MMGPKNAMGRAPRLTLVTASETAVVNYLGRRHLSKPIGLLADPDADRAPSPQL